MLRRLLDSLSIGRKIALIPIIAVMALAIVQAMDMYLDEGLIHTGEELEWSQEMSVLLNQHQRYSEEFLHAGGEETLSRIRRTHTLISAILADVDEVASPTLKKRLGRAEKIIGDHKVLFDDAGRTISEISAARDELQGFHEEIDILIAASDSAADQIPAGGKGVNAFYKDFREALGLFAALHQSVVGTVGDLYFFSDKDHFLRERDASEEKLAAVMRVCGDLAGRTGDPADSRKWLEIVERHDSIAMLADRLYTLWEERQRIRLELKDNHNQLMEITQGMVIHARDEMGTLVSRRRWMGFLTLVLAAGLLSLISVVVIRAIVKPLGRLTEAADKVRGLHLHGLVRRGRDDEIGDLARVLGEMSHRLEDTLQGMEKRIESQKVTEQSLWRELRVNSALAELAHLMISSPSDIEETSRIVLGYAQKLTESDYGYISEIDVATGNNVVLAMMGMMPGKCDVNREKSTFMFEAGNDGKYPALWGHSLNVKEPFFTNSPAEHEAWSGNVSGHILLERFLSVPVCYGDDLIGQISLANSAGEYGDRDLQAIVQIAELFAMILSRHRSAAERGQLEDQLRQTQKMEAIGTLAGGIAHDFNNILGAIIGNVNLTLDLVGDDREAKENLEEVLRAGRRATSLVKQILAFSRKRGKTRKQVEAQSIVKEALQLLRATLPATIEIRQHIDPDSGIVLVDPTELHQVVMNIATNAYYAMRLSGGFLTVKLEPVPVDSMNTWENVELTAGEYVKLTISDTGTGMDEATRERIFEPYFSTKEVGEGTGLGLAVVHGIVTSHSGGIVVESEPGQGTTFIVYFPKVQLAKEKGAEEEMIVPEGKERIAFIDDEEALTKVGEKMLEKSGYKVTAFNAPADFLKEFRYNPNEFDLIITDLTMPGMTGVDLTLELLSVRPDLPVVICTGYSEILNEEKTRDMGARALIMKPITFPELGIKVREILDNVPPADETE